MAAYPSVREIRQFWGSHRTPENIRQHCIAVGRVAGFLAFRLRQKGIKVDPYFCEAAGLLHDALKAVDFEDSTKIIGKFSQEDADIWAALRKKYFGKTDRVALHEFAISEIFRKDYPELALVLFKHGYHPLGTDLHPSSWEEIIVSYADKVAEVDSIVSLDERYIMANSRYHYTEKGQSPDPRKDKKWLTTYGMEKKIFDRLDFRPDQLEKELNKIELVIFDVDGVLIDSLDSVYNVNIECLAHFGLEAPFSSKKEFNEFFSSGWANNADRLPGDREIYWGHLRKRLVEESKNVKAFEGIVYLLESLHKKMKLAIVSDAREILLDANLDNNDLRKYFDFIISGSKETDKPSPLGLIQCIEKLGVWKTQAIFIGDMKVDVEAAIDANIRCIAVTYGYHERKHLNGAWKIADSVEELAELMKNG